MTCVTAVVEAMTVATLTYAKAPQSGSFYTIRSPQGYLRAPWSQRTQRALASTARFQCKKTALDDRGLSYSPSVPDCFPTPAEARKQYLVLLLTRHNPTPTGCSIWEAKQDWL